MVTRPLLLLFLSPARVVHLTNIETQHGTPHHNDAPDSVFAVMPRGMIKNVVFVSDAALKELGRQAQHKRTTDQWNKTRMKNYIKVPEGTEGPAKVAPCQPPVKSNPNQFTWVRLLEQARVQHIQAQGDALAALEAVGYGGGDGGGGEQGTKIMIIFKWLITQMSPKKQKKRFKRFYSETSL